MIKHLMWIAITPALLFANVSIAQQYPMIDALANRIVQKYNESSCEQLAHERAAKQGMPPPQGQQKVIQAMRNDPQMRAEFINRVAAPIANKMFECGLIP